MKKKSFRVVNQDSDIYGQQLLQLKVILAKDFLTKLTNSQFLYHLNLYVSVRLRAGMGCSGSPERWSKRGLLGVKLYILSTEDRFIGTFRATGTKCIFFYSEIIVCPILLSGLCSILFGGAAEKEAIDVKASIIVLQHMCLLVLIRAKILLGMGCFD